jgi:hypothetical protein
MAVRSLLKTILAVTTICLSLSASANLIFDFENNLGDNKHKRIYNLNGIVLTVTAFDDDEKNPKQKVDRSALGLGVNGNPKSGQIGNNEYLVFTFDEIFYGHLNITFGNWNRGDVAKITSNDDATSRFRRNNGIFTSDYAAVSSFRVEGTSKNAFRVANIELVPEPSALVILGLGLLGLGARRLKKANIACC